MSLQIPSGMHAAGLAQAWIVVAIALGTTAFGVLVPILRPGRAMTRTETST
jgi:hypothetical protein